MQFQSGRRNNPTLRIPASVRNRWRSRRSAATVQLLSARFFRCRGGIRPRCRCLRPSPRKRCREQFSSPRSFSPGGSHSAQTRPVAVPPGQHRLSASTSWSTCWTSLACHFECELCQTQHPHRFVRSDSKYRIYGFSMISSSRDNPLGVGSRRSHYPDSATSNRYRSRPGTRRTRDNTTTSLHDKAS